MTLCAASQRQVWHRSSRARCADRSAAVQSRMSSTSNQETFRADLEGRITFDLLRQVGDAVLPPALPDGPLWAIAQMPLRSGNDWGLETACMSAPDHHVQ